MTTKKPITTATAPKKAAVRKPASAPEAVNPAALDAAGPETKKTRQKVKVVRDSFTMPQDEYRKIGEIKEICLKAGLPVKKSEVLRAGLSILSGLSAARMKKVLSGLEKIKTGRPKKH